MLAVMSIPPATDRVQEPAIQVRGLEKSYKELRVLRGVDFEVARGSIFSFALPLHAAVCVRPADLGQQAQALPGREVG